MHQQRLYLLLLLLLLPITHVWAEKPIAPATIPGATVLSAEEAIELIVEQPSLVVIDTRKDEAYSKGHIEGAINLLDMDMTPETLAMHAADKQAPLLIYCNGVHCLRSTNAIKKAHDWGYSNLYWFRGGWNEWRDKKLPIAK